MNSRCEIPRENLSAYIDGELNSEESMRVEEHLSTCPECRRALESLRRTREFLAGLPSESPPEDLRVELREAISGVAAQDVPRTVRGRRRGISLAAVAAAAALVLLLPVAALLSTQLMVPGHDRLVAESGDPLPAEAPNDVGIMGSPPEIEPEGDEEAPEETPGVAGAGEDTVVVRDSLTLRAHDVEWVSANARMIAEEMGGVLRKQSRTFDSRGGLVESILILDAPPEVTAAVGEGIMDMGTLVARTTEEGSEGDIDGTMELVISVERTPDVPPIVVEEEPAEAVAYGSPSLLAGEMRRSFSGSWIRFGAWVGNALVWVAGHLPHLAFFATAFFLSAGVVRLIRRRGFPR